MSLFCKKIKAAEVKSLVPCSWNFLFDRRYKLPQDAEVKESIRSFIQRRGPFEYNEWHDCDNAAFELMNWMSGKGWPFGVCVLPGHAINLYIADDKKIRYIEPQTGKVRPEPKFIKLIIMA